MSEEYRALQPTLDTAVRVATQKTVEDIQDGVEVPELVRHIVAMYPVLTGYIAALEAENDRLREALEFEERYARERGALDVADRMAKQLAAVRRMGERDE